MSVKSETIALISEYADLMEFKGENKFKISAFRNTANVIRKLEGELENILEDGTLKSTKGIGKGILSFIEEYHQSGSVKEYEELKLCLPDNILEVMSVRGLGAKKAKTLYDTIRIKDLDTLEKACIKNEISEIPGFGKKTEESFLNEINRIKKTKGYVLLNRASTKSQELMTSLNDMKSVNQAEITGELRRSCEIISKIEILVLVKKFTTFQTELNNIFDTKKLEHSDHLATLKLSEVFGCDILIHVIDKLDLFYFFLLQTTGSQEFLKHLNILNPIIAESETQLFEKLKSPFIIPEMREKEYLDAPAKLKTNSNISNEQFEGLLHFHTTYSDGLNSLQEMVNAAKDYGFSYSAVCDHSKTAFYANGLNEERILLQKKEIDGINKKNSIKMFLGIESDILKDGSLDYDNDFLSNIDFLVVSVHSNFSMPETDMTKRIIKAIENPYTDVLGHPTGRLLLSRNPYKVDMKKIIDACRKNKVAIEINASPHRLDLDWRLIYYARQKGCQFAINPDAHSIKGISDMVYGIMVARKGGIQLNDIINCLNINEFKKYLNRKVKREFN